MNILLLGANGQLGRTFVSQGGLAVRGNLTAASRDGLLIDGGQGIVGDLTRPLELIAMLDQVQPSVIVNAAAYTAVDGAEEDEGTAHLVNSDAVAAIGQWSAAHGALVVHFSTDYVFAGDANTPYLDDAPVSPAGVYGRSKLAGERALRESGAPHFIFRTAWVYSAVGKNFLGTMLRLGAERDELRVVDDQRGTPTDTSLIVEGSLLAIDRWIAASVDERAMLQGTYHLTASGDTTWHGFAERIFSEAATRGILPRSPTVHAIQTSEFPTPAKRPAYSVLDNHRFAQTFSTDLPHWHIGLDRTLNTLSNPSE